MATLIVGAGGYATIQAAVDAANDGDTIEVETGIYVEQVIVDDLDNLTIKAADGADVTIQAPADLVETGRSSSDREIHGVLTVKNSLNVVIDDVDIDGAGSGNTVDEGGGAGQANFYGIFYRNSSGTLLDVDVTGVRDPYPGGTAAGGEPLVSGTQRGVGVVADNDTILAFTMTGGSIGDFQKNATVFSKADLDISGVTITGGGAQTIIAQNGIQVTGSTGSISGNTLTNFGYAGGAATAAGAMLVFANTDLFITDNIITGANDDTIAAKTVGIWVFTSGSGGEISGNTISYVDTGIDVSGSITPDNILIENNGITNIDTSNASAAGVDFEPNAALTTEFDVDGSAVHDNLVGGAGDDSFSGLGGIDDLTGNGGNDRLDGGGGADDMTGGAGNDTYIVDDAGDQVTELAGEGIDTVESSIDYTLEAEFERLILTGTAINGTGNSQGNFIGGNASANRLDGGGFADLMRGGAGDDLYVVDTSFDQIVELSGEGTDEVRTLASYTLPDHVENLTLMGGGNIDGTGNSLANVITGNDSNNVLDGAGGTDMLAGGEGHDTYVVENAGDQLIEGGSAGTDTVLSAIDYDLLTHFEKLVLTGNANHTGRGNSGDNSVTGNSGDNFLNGNSGDDIVNGAAGDDRLVGALGNDTLTGGAGNDRFEFTKALGPNNVDEIVDFSVPQDSIQLMDTIFTGTGPIGTLSAARFVQGTAAADPSDRIIYDSATGQIFYDADGTGATAQILFATVTAGTALTHADFVIFH